MRDAWLQKAAPRRRPSTPAEPGRYFRALRVPADVYNTLRHWAQSPDALQPMLHLVRDIIFSNAIHRAQMKRARSAAGTARDPHYKLAPEEPGALRPILEIVERVVSDLDRLITWEFKPAIELHELDAHLKSTGRVVSLAQLDERLRDEFERARRPLLEVRTQLREATRRRRGRAAALVRPFRISALASRRERPQSVRRRDLERLLRDELLWLHPDRKTRARAARVEVARMAHRILDAIL